MGGAYVGRLLKYVLNNGFKLDQAFGDQVYHQYPNAYPTPPRHVTPNYAAGDVFLLTDLHRQGDTNTPTVLIDSSTTNTTNT
jgi:hypothetical protein